MDYTKIAADIPEVSKVCLGTWAMGGWLWGGTDDKKSVETIHKALDMGINFIDTAPVYGFGKAEEVVGNAIASKKRDEIVIATKAGLEWQADEKVFRNSADAKIKEELEESLTRLKTDYIDLYQIHWPDPQVPIEQTAEVMAGLVKAGKIRAVGVSNYSVDEITRFSKICPVSTSQPPYNLFERNLEKTVIDYCDNHKITTLAYGSICRGLLSGRMTAEVKFDGDDLRNFDPKFEKPRFSQYLEAVSELDKLAQDRYQKNVIQLAVRWVLDRGNRVALWGARNPGQLDAVKTMFGWNLSETDYKDIDQILTRTVTDPIGPDFMQSPDRTHEDYRGKSPL